MTQKDYDIILEAIDLLTYQRSSYDQEQGTDNDKIELACKVLKDNLVPSEYYDGRQNRKRTP